MGYSNGILESDEKGGSGERGEQGLPGIGFKLTDDGNFDIDGKRLTDVSQPIDSGDAANKKYVDTHSGVHTQRYYHFRTDFTLFDHNEVLQQLQTSNIQGLLTDYSLGYYQLPVTSTDGGIRELEFILSKYSTQQGTYTALLFMYGYQNGTKLTGQDLGPILWDVTSPKFNVLHYEDDNSMGTVDHTKGVIWFTGGAGSLYIKLRFFRSLTHFVILTRCLEGKIGVGFNNEIFNVKTANDASLYFENINMNNRSITNLSDPTGPKQPIPLGFGDIRYLRTDGVNAMRQDLRMGQKRIVGLADPTGDGQATNKKYVDTENAKQGTTINNISSISAYNTNLITALQTSKADQSYVDDNFLNLDGSKSMTGNFNTGGNYIDGLPELVEDDKSDETLAKIKGRAIDFGYFKKQRDYLLPKDGSDPMEGNLNMTDSRGTKHSIVGLKDPQPSDSSYAASVNFVNNKIKESEERSIRSLNQENVFKKVMDDGLFIEDDDDIHQIGVVDKDFHKVNKKTYHFQIDYDNSIGYYSTRLGVNVVYLPIGYYILAFEMFFSDKIDNNNITVDCLSGTLQILSKNTKYSSNHSRSIFNFRKTVARPSDDELDIDITLKKKASEPTYDAKTDIFVVVYGVEGLGNDVESIIWDRYFYVDDKKIHFEASIDMVDKDIENVNNLSINNELNLNNRPIKKLGDGIEDTDGVNVKKLNGMETKITNYVTGEFGKVNPVLNNNSDLIKLIYRNLIRNDSKLFLIKELYFPDSIEGRTQNNYTYQTNGDNKGDVTFYLTFVHKATTSDNMMIILHWEGLSGNINIFVSKDKVETSINPLIDESSLASYNIPSYYQGKQVYLWITIQNDLIQINFSGSVAISGTHPDLENNDANIWRISVSDSPFTIQRGLITKNNYNPNSDAYKDVREYEISEGTFVSAV